ncbi:acyl-CoA dehydrogenase family protein [Streptomyces phaeoluteigriseus]|uniref:acyl-CoA dehydrogenase family protein n=1 Tax=Streptomyces phaeoluteigriseus TaxID=114686 RepID=UPI0009A1EEAA|nr:acyl-CoA dehydrogenase family protein [Streptomyces phaeoluteigriseus]
MSVDSIYFSPEVDTFREQTRRFLREHIAPRLDTWESERRIPRDTWKLLAGEGLLGLHHPRAYGGRELPFFHSVAYLEELGRLGNGGFRGAMSVHSYMATTYLQLAGDHEQKLAYLKPAVEGDMIAALAITEPHAGSDVSNISCEARATGDGYAIRGTKAFVTNGMHADFMVTAVRMADGPVAATGSGNISLLVIDAQAPGVTRTPVEKLGWHCSDTATVHFEDVVVDGSRLLGRKNSGFMWIMKAFQLERVAAAVLAIGEVDRALELARRYTGERQVFGKALAGHQVVRHRLAELMSHAEAARQLVYHAAWLHSRGKLAMSECAMAKLRATELAVDVAGQCLQLFGGHGYLADAPIARLFRDTRLDTIAGGASEIMREIIADTDL